VSSDPSTPIALETPESETRRAALDSSARDGLKDVKEDFLYWTGKLTDSSFQLSLALIGANWAAFGGSVTKVVSNTWAKTSLGLVVFGLALSLAGAKWMSELHGSRIDYADEDPERWAGECAAAARGRDPWPYTRGIERLGRCLREAKFWIPLIAGALFLIALFTST
jgi:hypothetical protein